MKKCSNKDCDFAGQKQELSKFHKKKGTYDGFHSRCKSCVKKANKKYHIENQESKNSRSKNYYNDNKEDCKIQQEQWRLNNQDWTENYNSNYYDDHKVKLLKDANNYYQNNKNSKEEYYQKNREEILKKKKLDRELNPEKYARRDLIGKAKRRAAKLQRSPKWADNEIIAGIYDAAKSLEQEDGIKRHVHHYYPLRGKLFSGLHVENNLVILTEEEHRKLNHYKLFS